jgi:hypothetical protein
MFELATLPPAIRTDAQLRPFLILAAVGDAAAENKMAFGYAENPPRPRIPAEGMTPFDLLPGQAADMTLVWPWAGEPYGSVGVGGWNFANRNALA